MARSGAEFGREADALTPGDQPLRAGLEVGLVGRLGGNAREPDVVTEVLNKTWVAMGGEVGEGGLHGGGGLGA